MSLAWASDWSFSEEKRHLQRRWEDTQGKRRVKMRESVELRTYKPRITGNNLQLRERHRNIPPGTLRASTALPTPALSRAVTEDISVLVSHPVCSILLRQPQEMNIEGPGRPHQKVTLRAAEPASIRKILQSTWTRKSENPEVGMSSERFRERKEAKGAGAPNHEGTVAKEPREVAWG